MLMMPTRIEILLLMTILKAIQLHGAPDYKGKEFIFAFMDNQPSSSIVKAQFPLRIFITTQSPNKVTVNVTAPKFNATHISQTVEVMYGEVKQVTFDKRIRMFETEKTTKGIYVSASDEIIVYGLNQRGLSTDASTLLPVDALGTEYYTVCYRGRYSYVSLTSTEVLIVGVKDKTDVSIRLPNNNVRLIYDGRMYRQKQWVNITLDRFEAFQFQSHNDLTGAYIHASEPVSVFSGDVKENIGPGHGHDHLEEQLMSVETWGKEFATVPIPHRKTGDYFRIIASQDNTNVMYENVTETIAEAGSFIEIHLKSTDYTYITSDKPICLVQFVLSQQYFDRIDPSMMIIPPIAQYASDYTFTTPYTSADKEFENYFLLLVKDADKDGLLLDGQHISASVDYHKINGSELVGGYLPIEHGTHTIRHVSPICLFFGTVFGRADHESYGFPIGMRSAPINTPCKVTVMSVGDGIDNDCDGKIDEEICSPDNTDDDGDGKIDEDCAQMWKDIKMPTTSTTRPLSSSNKTPASSSHSTSVTSHTASVYVSSETPVSLSTTPPVSSPRTMDVSAAHTTSVIPSPTSPVSPHTTLESLSPTMRVPSSPTTPASLSPTKNVSSSTGTPASSLPTSPISSSPTSPVSLSPGKDISSSTGTPASSSPTTSVPSSPTTPIFSSTGTPASSSHTTPVSSSLTKPVSSSHAMPVSSSTTRHRSTSTEAPLSSSSTRDVSSPNAIPAFPSTTTNLYPSTTTRRIKTTPSITSIVMYLFTSMTSYLPKEMSTDKTITKKLTTLSPQSKSDNTSPKSTLRGSSSVMGTTPLLVGNSASDNKISTFFKTTSQTTLLRTTPKVIMSTLSQTNSLSGNVQQSSSKLNLNGTKINSGSTLDPHYSLVSSSLNFSSMTYPASDSKINSHTTNINRGTVNSGSTFGQKSAVTTAYQPSLISKNNQSLAPSTGVAVLNQGSNTMSPMSSSPGYNRNSSKHITYGVLSGSPIQSSNTSPINSAGGSFSIDNSRITSMKPLIPNSQNIPHSQQNNSYAWTPIAQSTGTQNVATTTNLKQNFLLTNEQHNQKLSTSAGFKHRSSTLKSMLTTTLPSAKTDQFTISSDKLNPVQIGMENIPGKNTNSIPPTKTPNFHPGTTMNLSHKRSTTNVKHTPKVGPIASSSRPLIPFTKMSTDTNLNGRQRHTTSKLTPIDSPLPSVTESVPQLPSWFESLEMGLITVTTLTLVGGMVCLCWKCWTCCNSDSEDDEQGLKRKRPSRILPRPRPRRYPGILNNLDF